MPETFEEFKKRVDVFLVSFCGLASDDMVDACWYDLYEDIKDMRGPAFEEAVIDCMSDADEGFEQMARAITGG